MWTAIRERKWAKGEEEEDTAYGNETRKRGRTERKGKGMKGRSGEEEEKNRVMEGQKYRERVEAEVGYQKEGNRE